MVCVPGNLLSYLPALSHTTPRDGMLLLLLLLLLLYQGSERLNDLFKVTDPDLCS